MEQWDRNCCWSTGWIQRLGATPVSLLRGDRVGEEAETSLQKMWRGRKRAGKLQRELPGSQECRGVEKLPD